MLQNLARGLCARRATANFVSGSSPSIAYASRRSYATGLNKDILNLLEECAEKEAASTTINRYKVRSFRAAAATIATLDFKIQHGDDLKRVRNVGPGIKKRINEFLGHDVEESPKSPTPAELQKRAKAMKTLMTIQGIGTHLSGALYDSGCDTIEKLELKKYKEMLTPTSKMALKYFKFTGSPVPRENAERLLEFCKIFIPLDNCELMLAGDYRRDLPAIGGPIELLIVDESDTGPIPTPPHPSTLKLSFMSKRPTRIKIPFVQHYVTNMEKATSKLLNEILTPLERLSVASHTIGDGVNSWQGWVRVPKKGETWESKNERFDEHQRLAGDFHRVNITYIPKKSRGTGLFALTGDDEYVLDCMRKAAQAGLYLNEWGLWEWEPDSQSLSRFKTSDAPHEKTSLGAMWGSETEEDKGRWVQLETTEEEQIMSAIGAEYVPPNKRNFRFLLSKQAKTPRKGRVFFDE